MKYKYRTVHTDEFLESCQRVVDRLGAYRPEELAGTLLEMLDADLRKPANPSKRQREAAEKGN